MHKIHEKYFTFMNYYQNVFRIVQKSKIFSMKRENVTVFMKLEAISDDPQCLNYKIFFTSGPTMVDRRVLLNLQKC